MNVQVIELAVVLVMVLNFYALAATRLQAVIYSVSAQGVILGLIYPLAHSGAPVPFKTQHVPIDALTLLRLILLSLVIVAVKGYVIPRLLLQAVRQTGMRGKVESIIGMVPPIFIAAAGTGLAMMFARTLPLRTDHSTTVIVPAALATALAGFLLLTTRRVALSQVLGYLVLENGIFIFGLLLVEALPGLVEMGVLLDVFVGVFVMGIIIHHVSREFPEVSTEHMAALKE